MDTISALKQYGLDEREAALYLAALELGPSPVHQVADRAKVKRTTAYLTAQSLKEKGLLSEYRDKQGVHLVAEPPERLLDILALKENRIRDILPELRAAQNKEAAKPKLTYYEGREGIRAVCEDTLQIPDSEILFTSSLQDVYKMISQDYDTKHYIPARLQKKIKFRMLVFHDQTTEEMRKHDREELRETRFLPDGYPFTATQFVYGNKVAYIGSEKELVGVIIESVEIATLERQKFEMLWSWLEKEKNV